jgi:mono/diheme cytochrome c family protein
VSILARHEPWVPWIVAACLAIGFLTAFAAAQDTRAGAALYGEQCATCHGADARGLNGPDLWVRPVAAKRAIAAGTCVE